MMHIDRRYRKIGKKCNRIPETALTLGEDGD